MADAPELTRPDDKLEIVFNEAKKVLFMSYQRLNSCLRVLGEPDNLALFMLDPDMTENMIKTVVAEAGAGNMVDTVIHEGAIGYEDSEKILLWVRDHLTHFFLKRFQDLGSQGAVLGPTVDHLKSSLPGLDASTSPAPAAGPSGAVQVTSKTSGADAPSTI